MERLKQHFRDQGLTALDIPKAIVLGLGMALSFWAACYSAQPSARFARPLKGAVARHGRMERLYSGALVKSQQAVARMPWLQRVRDPGRLTVSLAESICLRATIKPATFPFKIWASYKLVLLTKPGHRRPAGVLH